MAAALAVVWFYYLDNSAALAMNSDEDCRPTDCSDPLALLLDRSCLPQRPLVQGLDGSHLPSAGGGSSYAVVFAEDSLTHSQREGQ